MSDAESPNNDLPLEHMADLAEPFPEPTEPTEPTEPAEATEATDSAPPEVHATGAVFAPPPGEAPTIAMPSVAPMLGTNTPAGPKKRGVLAWALAGIAAVAAIVFAVLWVGKSGDADDLTTERNFLVAEKAGLEDTLATAQSDLTEAKAELDTATSDLDVATSDIDDLQAEVDERQAQVDDLTSRLEAAQSQPDGGQGTISDSLALRLAQSLSIDADPPLTDAEHICLGHAFYAEVGLEAIVELGITPEPTDEQLSRLVLGLFRSATLCELDMDRLNP